MNDQPESLQRKAFCKIKFGVISSEFGEIKNKLVDLI